MLFNGKLIKVSTTIPLIIVTVFTFFMPYSVVLAPPTTKREGLTISKEPINQGKNYITFSFNKMESGKIESKPSLYRISFKDALSIERLSYRINYFENLITEVALRADLTEEKREIINLELWFRLLQNGDMFIFLRCKNKGGSIKDLSYSVEVETQSLIDFDKTEVYEFSYKNSKDGMVKIVKSVSLKLNGNTLYLKAARKEKTKFTLFKGLLFQFRDLEYGLQERIDNPSFVSINTKPGNGEIDILNNIMLSKDSFFEDWYLFSERSLLNINSAVSRKYLEVTDFSLKKRYSENGFYYLTENNSGYRNETKNTYYWDYSMYAPRSLLEFYFTGSEGFIYDIAMNSFYALSKSISKDGFWSSGTESVWLKNDYGIGTYYFDTRFSVDAAIFLLWVYKKFNNKEALKLATNIGNLLLKFMSKGYGFKTVNNGFLFSDYIVVGNNKLKTHASLNHILNEVYFLLMLYDLTSNSFYKEASLKLINGVAYFGESWINKENGDLYYCITPLRHSIESSPHSLDSLRYSLEEGNPSAVRFERRDYPTLTYYDLIKTNEIIQKVLNFSHSPQKGNPLRWFDIIKKLGESKEKFLLSKGIIKVKKFTAGREIKSVRRERAD